MINLKDVYFGCSDANTEAERNPNVFKKVFFDPNDYIEELLDGDRFILRGRKGDGKTAYGAQIHLTAAERNFYVYQRSLDNFNNATFLQIKTYDNLGGNPYISFWKCVLLIEYVSMIYKYEPNIDTEGFFDIVDSLNQYGLLSMDNDISTKIKKLVETNTTINIKFIQYNRKRNYHEELQGAEQIYTAIKNAIQNIYLTKRFVMIIDGLDDILDSSEFRANIITGLIRATAEINKIFKKSTLKIKTIILIRDDILNLCRDPNISKVRRDSSIHLSWEIPDDPYDSPLLQLVGKRIESATNGSYSFRQMWEEVFPQKIGTRNSLDYILENIIYRPRDLLQFFVEIQKVFTPGKQLTVEKVKTALFKYSEEYFVDAMRDELTGFFPDDVVTLLPNILSKMGRILFYLADFEAECSRYPEFKNIPLDVLLEKLFEAGYIGQHRQKDTREYTVFSYRNPREVFDEKDECIVHRGLIRALTI